MRPWSDLLEARLLARRYPARARALLDGIRASLAAGGADTDPPAVRALAREVG